MKLIQRLIMLLVACTIISCSKDEELIGNDLYGSWTLVRSTIFDGRVAVTEDVSSSSSETITFTSKGALLTMAVTDSTLRQASYFKTGYNSLVGPVLDVYKADNQFLASLKYVADRDVLVIQPFIGRSFSYEFRRLK